MDHGVRGVRGDSDRTRTGSDKTARRIHAVLEPTEFGPSRRARCVEVLVGPPGLFGPAAEAEALVLQALDVIRRMPPIREKGWLNNGASSAMLALREALPEEPSQTIRPLGEEIDMADRVVLAVATLGRFDRMLVWGRLNRMSWKRLAEADPQKRKERALRDARKRALLAVWEKIGE